MTVKTGFVYDIEILDRRRILLHKFRMHNLVPEQGLNHILSVVCKSGAQVPTWYLAPFEGNYTPVNGDTAATFPGSATECTAYTAGTRLAWVPGTPTAGVLDNSASVAEFTMNADKTLYGAFMVSAAAKGAVSGSLLSAAKFPSPRVIQSGGILRITAGLILSST